MFSGMTLAPLAALIAALAAAPAPTPAPAAPEQPRHLLVATYGSGPAAELAQRYLEARVEAGDFEREAFAYFWTELTGDVTVGSLEVRDANAGAVVSALVRLLDPRSGTPIAVDAARFLVGPAAGLSRDQLEQIGRSIRPGTMVLVAVVSAEDLPRARRAFDVTGPRRMVDGALSATR
jgi:hypothetical protein